MRKLLTILLILSASVCFGQAWNTGQVKPSTATPVQAPENATIHINKLDTIAGIRLGSMGYYAIPSITTLKKYRLKSDTVTLKGTFSNFKALGKEDKSNKENTTVDNSTIKYPTVNLLKTYADTKDPSSTNELNTSVSFDPNTNILSVTDAGGSKSATIDINSNPQSNEFRGVINVTSNPVTLNWPVAYSDINYYLDIFPYYTETIDGKSVRIRNAVYDFAKTVNGFSLKVDTIAGVIEYRASRTINSETPANVVLQSDLTTVVGDPGLDTKIPTEKAVRTAIAAGGGMVYPASGIPISTGSAWGSSITDNSTNWNTAYTDRLKWDGGSTELVPSTGRTSLGGTTIGSNLFTLTNPSAITFPRFNADNTVSSLSAADFKAAIGGGATTNPLTVKFDTGTTEGTDLYTFDGSASKTMDIKAGTNVTFTKAANSITVNASGGGGVSDFDLMKYQEGGLAPSTTNTGVFDTYGIFSPVYMFSGGGFSIQYDRYGLFASQSSTGSIGSWAGISANGASKRFNSSQLPVMVFKFKPPSSGTYNTQYKIGLTTGFQALYNSSTSNIVLYSNASNRLFFATSNGASSQTTDTGISFSSSSPPYLLMIQVNSMSSITYTLYDANTYSIISTATHTNSIPTVDMYLMMSMYDGTGNVDNVFNMYFGKIKLKR